MRVLEPKELENRRTHRKKQRKQKKRKYAFLPFLLLVIGVYAAVSLLAPLPNLTAKTEPLTIKPGTPVSLPWPGYGQAALGAVGYGLLAQHGDQKPLPTASVAKVLTALAVLKVRPITASQNPTLTLTAADVAIYNKYVSDNQSVVKVAAGEQLSEYQALQALLLPSANNMADALANWAFGSMESYLAFANPFTKTLGMANTHVADASGFSAQTTSTAVDLTKLAEIAMNQPVIAEIVNQAQADLPVAGIVYNVNMLVGHDGVVGIKTGNTDEAGGCYMFSARRKIDTDHTITVVGTVMGATNLSQAITDALPLIDETFKGFTVMHIVQADTQVGTIAGASSSKLVVKQGLFAPTWADQQTKTDVVLHALGSMVQADDAVGTLEVHIGDLLYNVPVVANATTQGHNLWWRLLHAGGRF